MTKTSSLAEHAKNAKSINRGERNLSKNERQCLTERLRALREEKFGVCQQTIWKFKTFWNTEYPRHHSGRRALKVHPGVLIFPGWEIHNEAAV
jgi:hypothetical protein